ncbi:hypothetical protein LDL08_20840 [Nonomuraea glycinis]|uniref:Uncharacterized protein n=1 Tax=Nonomuraea glycinis TaxID=2047744 RepID=A0A918E821_9ACTN|nr:hypothetical protein [Nonomuraea glycinis]MCA2178639.1 hypothetical protein [Nonomuraea glycinis]GGP13811.1 hypothetical protein GCM10012278_67050 [Nonomuraea glycinis]
MKRQIVAGLIIVGLIGTSGLAVVASAAGSLFGTDTGCAGAEQRLQPVLSSLAILDQAPAGAEALGGRSSGCEAGDLHVYVGQNYRFTGGRADVLAFYDQQATQSGWRRAPANPSVTNDRSLCYTGSVGGGTAFAYVWFPGDSGLAASNEYNVTVSALGGESANPGAVMC